MLKKIMKIYYLQWQLRLLWETATIFPSGILHGFRVFVLVTSHPASISYLEKRIDHWKVPSRVKCIMGPQTFGAFPSTSSNYERTYLGPSSFTAAHGWYKGSHTSPIIRHGHATVAYGSWGCANLAKPPSLDFFLTPNSSHSLPHPSSMFLARC